MLDLLTGDLTTALGGLVVAAVGALGLFLKGYFSAKNKAEAKNTKRRLKAVLKKQEDQDDVSQIDDTSLADRITRRR